MEIAGTVFLVQPLFQSTIEYCRPYLTDRDPECIVEVSREDLIAEQLLLDREAVEEGLKLRKFKEPFLERSVIQRRVADHLVSRDVLMMHGSTVAVDGAAYLFTAACGTGKSTHTRLWRELFGDRAVMVNDDKPFLRITPNGVLTYGSPWSGKHGLASNVCVPLRGICLLHRGKENQIHRLNLDSGRDFLRKQVHMPADESLNRAAFFLADALFEQVPLWEMHCNKEVDAAVVSYLTMCPGQGSLQWIAYGDAFAQTVNSWLDEEAVSMTGLDSGWDAYWQAVKEDAVHFPGCQDFCKLIFVGERPCAAVCFGTFQDTLTISELVVDPKLRGQGIGTRLLIELTDMAKNQKFGSVKCLTAVVFLQNTASQKAFQKAGFRLSGKTEDGVDLIYTYTL